MSEQTFWNGQPCAARKVVAVVGESMKSTYWHNGMEGTSRKAVEVVYADQAPFYLDNEDGSGWYKVTEGKGSPSVGHKSLPVTNVIGEDQS